MPRRVRTPRHPSATLPPMNQTASQILLLLTPVVIIAPSGCSVGSRCATCLRPETPRARREQADVGGLLIVVRRECLGATWYLTIGREREGMTAGPPPPPPPPPPPNTLAGRGRLPRPDQALPRPRRRARGRRARPRRAGRVRLRPASWTERGWQDDHAPADHRSRAPDGRRDHDRRRGRWRHGTGCRRAPRDRGPRPGSALLRLDDRARARRARGPAPGPARAEARRARRDARARRPR